MIRVNDKFEFSYEPNNWILTEWRHGWNDEKQCPTRTSRRSYYATLPNLCGAIIDRSAGQACNEVGDIVEAVRLAKLEIFLAIQGGGIQ